MLEQKPNHPWVKAVRVGIIHLQTCVLECRQSTYLPSRSAQILLETPARTYRSLKTWPQLFQLNESREVGGQ